VIHVVIVGYNSAHVLAGSIAPLMGNPEIRVTLVDNASSDDTVQIIRDSFPAVDVIEAGGNLGFAKAVNLGVASGKDTDDYVLLLNPDAVISADDVVLLAASMRREGVQVGAPHVAQPAGTFKILELGRFPSLRAVFYHYSGLSRFAGRIPSLEGQFLLKKDAPGSRDVEWVTGAVLMIKRESFEQLGGLSERWFMYAEDIDLCFRASRSGMRTRYFSNIPAEHIMGASTSSKSSKTNSAPFVNLLDFYSLSMAPSQAHVLAWRVTVAGGLLSRAVLFFLRGAKGKASRSHSSETAYWLARARTFYRYARDVLSTRLERK
jgi:N-acetylglucosaminyl-diphospho-decaprenol L-rhamnosyltransferase